MPLPTDLLRLRLDTFPLFSSPLVLVSSLVMFQRYIFVVALAFTAHSLASCYWPNGTVANVGSGNRVQKPCNKTPGVHSMCCFLEGPSNPPTLDTCTPDGLCKPQDNYHIWRGTCTDSTWQDPACLNLCTVGKSKQTLRNKYLRPRFLTGSSGLLTDPALIRRSPGF